MYVNNYTVLQLAGRTVYVYVCLVNSTFVAIQKMMQMQVLIRPHKLISCFSSSALMHSQAMELSKTQCINIYTTSALNIVH